MGIYIKNWSLADWKELLTWAKIGANNAMIGEFSEVEEIQPHGRLIDADALIADVRAHSESYFADDFAHEWVDVAPTIIPADPA